MLKFKKKNSLTNQELLLQVKMSTLLFGDVI